MWVPFCTTVYMRGTLEVRGPFKERKKCPDIQEPYALLKTARMSGKSKATLRDLSHHWAGGCGLHHPLHLPFPGMQGAGLGLITSTCFSGAPTRCGHTHVEL